MELHLQFLVKTVAIKGSSVLPVQSGCNKRRRKIMKKNTVLLFLFFCSPLLFAEIPLSFFGGNNFGISTGTIFSTDLNDGSTGFSSWLDCDLWFEFTPYADRGISPQKKKLSVSLKLANSAWYAWRGYSVTSSDNYAIPNDLGDADQSDSVWFNTLIAQVQYGEWWTRVAGIEPDITIDQASIRSVLDNTMSNRTGDKNMYFCLPLFHSGGPYAGNGGIASVIGRDLVHLNKREVEVYGMYSIGYDGLDLQADLKAGSWKNGEENDANSWVFGSDITWNIDLKSTLKFNILAAVNYGEYDLTTDSDGNYIYSHTTATGATEVDTGVSAVDDPEADADALVDFPVAMSLGYEYRLDLPNRMVLKPYAGLDVIYELETNDYDYEAGGGMTWYFRGTGAQFKRNTKFGGMQLSGDCANQVGLSVGANVDKEGVVNAIVSFDEDPNASPIKNIGGFAQFEFMNIIGKEYVSSANDTEYSDYLWAFICQIEWKATNKMTPFIFGWYVPSVDYADSGKNAYNNFNDNPTYDKDDATIMSKIGCRFTPFDHIAVDVWYQRIDQKSDNLWDGDRGSINFSFEISL
jgi:hypothetical protein